MDFNQISCSYPTNKCSCLLLAVENHKSFQHQNSAIFCFMSIKQRMWRGISLKTEMCESEEWMFRAGIMLYSLNSGYSVYSGYILSLQRVCRVYIYIVQNILSILWVLSDRGSYAFYSDDHVCVCLNHVTNHGAHGPVSSPHI